MSKWVQFSVAVVTPGTPVALPTAQVSKFCLRAKRATGDNSGMVYVGDSAVHRTTNQGMAMAAGRYWELEVPARAAEQSFDLGDFCVDADTATDGVVGFYLQA